MWYMEKCLHTITCTIASSSILKAYYTGATVQAMNFKEAIKINYCRFVIEFHRASYVY